jgi:hypothetical protein
MERFDTGLILVLIFCQVNKIIPDITGIPHMTLDTQK